MQSKPFISICLPVYDRPEYLERLLECLEKQTFKDFEVIITDNSNHDRLEKLADTYRNKLNIKYARNNPATSMAGNWNNGIQMAAGTWLKIIHDDDMFAANDTLERFAAATNHKEKFIFSGHELYYEHNKTTTARRITSVKFRQLKSDPFVLIADNIIGPPSTVMIHHSIREEFDTRLKWLIDVDWYINILKKNNWKYVPETLIQISQNPVQETHKYFRNKEVEIYELLVVINKYQIPVLSSTRLYNTCWRLIRNLRITNTAEFAKHAKEQYIPPYFYRIIKQQQYIPGYLLRKGVISRAFMLISLALMQVRKHKNP